MTREEAIQVLKNTAWLGANEDREATEEAIDMAIEALQQPQTDLIGRADAVKAIRKCKIESDMPSDWYKGMETAQDIISALSSAEAVQGWRTGKPKKQGEYTVTVKSMRGGMVELLYYGKPLMPNRKVKGMCWYRSDDEWGDVVYDDKDILAWMPLPKPYRGGDEV